MAIDAFSNERASFAERLARLAGGTTWREPIGGYGTKSDNLPDVHALAASLAFARNGKNDIGPDLVMSIICQMPSNLVRITTELAAALLAASGRIGEDNADELPIVASRSYRHLVTGEPVKKPVGMNDRDWILLHGLACRMLWDAVTVSVRRAERAYRAEAA